MIRQQFSDRSRTALSASVRKQRRSREPIARVDLRHIMARSLPRKRPEPDLGPRRFEPMVINLIQRIPPGVDEGSLCQESMAPGFGHALPKKSIRKTGTGGNKDRLPSRDYLASTLMHPASQDLVRSRIVGLFHEHNSITTDGIEGESPRFLFHLPALRAIRPAVERLHAAPGRGASQAC